jgi:hypothetical protein
MARTYRKLPSFVNEYSKEEINKLRSSGIKDCGSRIFKAYDKDARRKKIQELRNYARKIAQKLSLILQE